MAVDEVVQRINDAKAVGADLGEIQMHPDTEADVRVELDIGQRGPITSIYGIPVIIDDRVSPGCVVVVTCGELRVTDEFLSDVEAARHGR